MFDTRKVRNEFPSMYINHFIPTSQVFGDVYDLESTFPLHFCEGPFDACQL